MSTASRGRRWFLVALFAVDAAVLAVLELFFLPLRLDGLILPRVSDLPLPITVLVAALTTPWLVRQAAKQTSRRLATVPLVVWLATLLVLGLRGPGGDVVLLPDWRTLALLVAGALTGAVALGSSLGTGKPR